MARVNASARRAKIVAMHSVAQSLTNAMNPEVKLIAFHPGTEEFAYNPQAETEESVPTFLENVATVDITDQAAELDAALATLEDMRSEELEAQVLEVEAEEQALLDIENEQPDRPVSFKEAMSAFGETEVQAMTMRIVSAVDTRCAFEHAKHGAGHNIEKNLAKVRKEMMWGATSRVMLAANVDPAFINRTLHDGSCYNVYAIGKVADAVKGLAEGVISNAINRACMVSLFQMRRAGLPFTSEVAKACASDKHPIDIPIRKHLLRHTVSASTAPTQASSTMQALETLGIVRREGSSRNAVYHLTDAPITQRLEEVLFPKAA